MAGLGRLLALAALLALLVPAFRLDRRAAMPIAPPAPSPLPELAPAVQVEPSRAPRSTRARPRPAPPAAAPSQSPAVPPLVSLDDLLFLPKARPNASRDLELDAGRAGSAQAETPRRRRVRVDFSRKRPLEGVPMQPEQRRTDVGVAVGVDESDKIRVRGGVRVNEREKAEGERAASTTPTVGVEVRF